MGPVEQAPALLVLGRTAAGFFPGSADQRARILALAFRKLGIEINQQATPTDAQPPARVAAAVRDLRRAGQGPQGQAFHVLAQLAADQHYLPLPLNRFGRLLEESFGPSSPSFARAFQDCTGDLLPGPWDPSDPTQWKVRDAGTRSRWEAPPPAPEPRRRSDPPRIARIKALALLGLDEGADPATIKQAFLRISKVHHPDLFAGQGETALREASETFRRIREAYEFLIQERAR